MASSSVSAYPRLSEAEKELADDRYDAAAAHVLEHLRQRPGEARGLALLGRIALRTGALVQAEQFLRQAMAAGLSGIDVQRDLASTINQQERPGDALRAFEHLETIFDDPQITATRALILDKLGRNAQALPIHAALARANADDPPYWIAYGHSLRAAGRIDEAVSAYRAATAADPERGEAWWAIANVKSNILTETDIAIMEEMATVAVDLLNIVPLHFALGRAFHDRAEYQRAFHHFAEGNRLRAGTLRYRPEELSSEIDQFIREFGPDFFERTAAELPSVAPVPVFLISLPRSGSTLLEQMLDQHSQITAVGELPYIGALLRSTMEIHIRHGPATLTQVLLGLGAEEKRKLGEDYLARTALHKLGGAHFFIDKMPMNWSNVLFIRQILPQAKFIEIRRNGMDCGLSNFLHYFSMAHPASFDLDHMGRAYVDYVRLMDHVDAAASGLIQHVRYEALVDDPVTELRGVLNYLGLDWQPELLLFHESARVVRTPSAEQVRRPLNRQGIGAAKCYGRWLQPLRAALGPLADT